MKLSINQGVLFYLIALLLIGLNISPFLNGISQIAILALLFFSLPKSFYPFFLDKKVQIFTVFLLIQLFSILYSTNLQYALKDLRIKSVFLLFPFLFAVFGKINRAAYTKLLWILTIGAILSIIAGVYKVWQLPDLDMRQYSIFISHIRFSYILAAIILLHLYEILLNQKLYSLTKLIAIAILFSFMIFLSSLSAIFAFLITATIILYLYFTNLKLKIFLAILFLGPTIFGLKVLFDYLPNESFENQLKKYQLSGNENYYLRVKAKENGNYIGFNLNESEIEKIWPEISGMQIDSARETIPILLRYLSSLGLSKDSAGITKLSPNDIQNIKSGISNYNFATKSNLYNRLYILYWEIDRFGNGEMPVGHSFTQRLIFWKAALGIIWQNPFFGVGIGDLPDSFAKYYQEKMPFWPEKFRKKTHNQFLSFFVSNGLLGGSMIIFALYLPFFLFQKKNIQLKIIILLMSISMLTEDTFETQAGATFFAFMYNLFLYADFENQEVSSPK